MERRPAPLGVEIGDCPFKTEGADAAFFSPAAWAAAASATAVGCGWRRSAVRLFDDDDENGEKQQEAEGVAFFDSSSGDGGGGRLSAARASASSLDDFGSSLSGRGRGGAELDNAV